MLQPIATWLAGPLLGLLTWTFFEYAVHRWLFHGRFMEQLHAIHHRAPWRRYLIPLRLVGPLTALVGLPLWVLGWQVEAAWALGVFFGWRCHEYLHRRFHAHKDEPADLGAPGWLGRLWLRHQSHHRFDWPGNFGVTTSLWDRVFRTEERVAYHVTPPAHDLVAMREDYPVPPELDRNVLAMATTEALRWSKP